MDDKQEYLLKLFKEIDAICKKHHLRYVLAGGSLIGAIRHEGFIPWDDDMDLYMPRDDWNRFVEISKNELPPDRAVQCVDVDRNYTNTFPRYASTDTCAIHRHQIIGNDKAGEIIDVLTLDPIPPDDREYEKYRTHMMIYSDLVNISFVYSGRFEVPVHLYIKYLLMYLFLGRDRTLKKLEKIMFSYKEEDCTRYAMRWGGCPFLFDKDMMFPVKYGKFEGVDAMIPARTSDYLIWHYGDEWSYIPPNTERESHDAVECPGINYEEFRKEYMPGINKFRLRVSAVKRKIYSIAKAKSSHRTALKRRKLLGEFTVMDLKKRILESSCPIQELVRKKDYSALSDIFQEYFRVQLSADFIGREDSFHIFAFYHPTLLEVDDEIFSAAMLTLMNTERISKAYRMLQVRENLSSLTEEMIQFKKDIELFRHGAGCYEAGEMREGEQISDSLLEKYPDNPSFMKFKIRFVMEQAKNSKKLKLAEPYLARCLNLYPEDGYFLKYKGDILWMMGQCLDALNLYAKARETTNNGITQLEIDKFLREYKMPALHTCQSLAENHEFEEAEKLAILWRRLLPKDHMTEAYYYLVKAMGTEKENTEELYAEIQDHIKNMEPDSEDDTDRISELFIQALSYLWEKQGYSGELADIKARLDMTDNMTELKNLEKRVEKSCTESDKEKAGKVLGEILMKQGRTQEALRNGVWEVE